MRKKLLSVILVVSAAIGVLTGCGESKNSTPVSNVTSESEDIESESEETDDGSAAEALQRMNEMTPEERAGITRAFLSGF